VLFVQDVGGAGSVPVAFTNGTPTSALTYTFCGLGNGADDVEFSNNGGTTWTHTPVANASGCDPAVTHIHAYKSEAEGHDGGRKRVGRSVFRGQVPGESELEAVSGYRQPLPRPQHWV